MQRLIIIFEQVSEGCSSKRVQKAGNTGTMTLCDDKGDGKPKRRCNRPNRGRAQCKRSYQLLSSRYRAIASAGAILVAMHVATSPSRANALSWIDAARATGDAGRCSASDAKTGAVSTISRSCARNSYRYMHVASSIVLGCATIISISSRLRWPCRFDSLPWTCVYRYIHVFV